MSCCSEKTSSFYGNIQNIILKIHIDPEKDRIWKISFNMFRLEMSYVQGLCSFTRGYMIDEHGCDMVGVEIKMIRWG